MEGFIYKEYTEAEAKIYNEAMAKIIEGLRNGLDFNEACNITNVEDKELAEFIKDDALKIMIAELHYMQGISLQEVADLLKVPIKPVNEANIEMLEDVEISAIEVYEQNKQNNPDKPIGNA